jgi:uncharacterized membrane protein YkvA (DUF1232 family)
MSKALKPAAHGLQLEIKFCRLVLEDKRVPRLSKWLLGLALAYALSPINLISNIISPLGMLDDFIIVPGLLILALKLIPAVVLEDCRAQAKIMTSSPKTGVVLN